MGSPTSARPRRPGRAGRGPRVVAAAAGLVPFDDPAGVLHRRAGDGRREHGLPQHLPHVQRGPPAQLVLGVREMRHLLQPRPDDDTAPVADGAHHLQLLVDDHRQLLGLLAVGEELQQALDGRPLGWIPVRAADRVHHHRAARAAHMHLRTGSDQGALPGVHDERPVRAALALEQPAEQRQGVRPPEAGDLAPVGAPDHEIRALARADLVAQHPADDPLVLLVVDVEAAARDPHRVRRQLPQRLRERDGMPFLGHQCRQRGAVVADVEAALADLPEGHHRQALVGQGGQALEGAHRAEQHLHQIVVAARRAAPEQGEGAGVGQQPSQVHGSSFRFSCRRSGEERPGCRIRRRPPLGRPVAKSSVRAVSGPPRKRSTTTSGASARTCEEL